MNKAQLIDSIVQQVDISKVKAGEVIDSIIASITKALEHGESITLVGFGSFSVAHRAKRVGRNPKTGKEIEIPATKTPKFKAGKALKESVSGKKKVAKPAVKKPAVGKKK